MYKRSLSWYTCKVHLSWEQYTTKGMILNCYYIMFGSPISLRKCKLHTMLKNCSLQGELLGSNVASIFGMSMGIRCRCVLCQDELQSRHKTDCIPYAVKGSIQVFGYSTHCWVPYCCTLWMMREWERCG